jgi:hypothetical protein
LGCGSFGIRHHLGRFGLRQLDWNLEGQHRSRRAHVHRSGGASLGTPILFAQSFLGLWLISPVESYFRIGSNTPGTADRASQVLNERIGDDALIEI